LLHNGCTLEGDFALTHEMEDAVLTVWLHVDILVAGAMLYCDEPALHPPWFMAMWFVIAFFGDTGDVPSRFRSDQPPVAAAEARGGAGAAGCASASDADTAAATLSWFSDFLIDRATRRPSEHTLKACAPEADR
jgi:hypothetical protein